MKSCSSSLLNFRCVLAAALLIAGGMPGCERVNSRTLEVTGEIESDAVTAGSRVGGRVAEVLVEEGARVTKDAVIIRLDSAEAQAVMDTAKAQRAQAEAANAKLQAGATAEQLAQAEAAARAAKEQYQLAEAGARSQEKIAARAALDGAQAQLNAARLDFDRAKRLLDQEVLSKQKYDMAEAAYKTAEAQMRSARERSQIVDEGARKQEIGMAKANLDRANAFLEEVRKGPRAEDLAAGRAAVDAAAANVARAEVALREMEVIAPIDGLIESLDVHPGDLVKPGPVVRIVNPEDLEMTVYVGAAMLGHLQVGQKIPFTTDAHGTKEFEGLITYIASEGEYTPRNLQTEEERVQQVFAVKLDLDSTGGLLRPGMTAIAHLPNTTAGD